MIKLYSSDEAATRRKIAQVARLYSVPKRVHRVTGKPSVNLSATIDRALDIAIAAAQTSGDRELARERAEGEAK